MAMIYCNECNNEISDSAKTCPHCGHSKNKSIGIAPILMIGIIFLFILGIISSLTKTISKSKDQSSLSTSSSIDSEACDINKINVKITKIGFVDSCSASSCYTLKGAAIINNGCQIPIGVEIKLTGYDANKIPISVKSGWPASVSNIPPGDYPISLDHWLDYDSSIKFYTAEVIDLRSWKNRR